MPATAWQRFWRMAACLADAGLLLALATVAAGAQQQQQQPQRECSTIAASNNPGAILNLGAILLDRCTGKAWLLSRVARSGGGYIIRWLPIAVDASEPTSAGP